MDKQRAQLESTLDYLFGLCPIAAPEWEVKCGKIHSAQNLGKSGSSVRPCSANKSASNGNTKTNAEIMRQSAISRLLVNGLMRLLGVSVRGMQMWK